MDRLSQLKNQSNLNYNMTDVWKSYSCDKCQTDLKRLKEGHVATQVSDDRCIRQHFLKNL